MCTLTQKCAQSRYFTVLHSNDTKFGNSRQNNRKSFNCVYEKLTSKIITFGHQVPLVFNAINQE